MNIVEIIQIIFRFLILICFELFSVFLIPNIFKKYEKNKKISGNIIIFVYSLFASIFFFIDVNGLAHNWITRIHGDTYSTTLYFYSKNTIYINAPLASIIIILFINIGRCCLNPFQTVQFFFSLVLPCATIMASYYFFHEFCDQEKAYLASMIFFQFDIILDSMTGNVKQSIGLIFLLICMKLLLLTKKNLDKVFTINNKSIKINSKFQALLYLIFAFIIFITHFITYLVSMFIIPIISGTFKFSSNNKLEFYIPKNALSWNLIVVLYPFVYPTGVDTQAFHIFSLIFIFFKLPDISADLAQNSIFISMILLIVFISVYLLIYLYLISYRIYIKYSLNYDLSFLKYLIGIFILITFFIYIGYLSPSVIRDQYNSPIYYWVLDIPRIIFLYITIYSIVNFRYFWKDKLTMNIDKISPKSNYLVEQNDLNLFLQLGLGIVVFICLYFVELFILDIGQIALRSLTFSWIFISWLVASLYLKEQNKSTLIKQYLLYLTLIIICIFFMLVGTRDPLFFKTNVW